MRILHILSDSNVGGAGILLENLLRHTGILKEHICVILPRGAAMAERYRALGVAVRDVLPAPDASFALRNLPILIHAIREFSPDAVHTHACLIGRVAAFLCGVPVRIATRHCAYPVGRAGRPLRRLLHRMGDAILTTCTVATAHAAEKNLRELGIPPKRIVMIRNGAEALIPMPYAERRARRAALGIGEDDFCLGMAARLVHVKGADLFLHAVAGLLRSGEKVHALLVGDGPERKNLERLAAHLDIAEHVTLTGFASDPAPYINLFDATVNCSRGTETSCLALSEAMSLGIPVIASDFGGNPEMVCDGVNGLLFPVEDEEALVQKTTRLLRDKSLYASLSAGARRRFEEEFDAKEMARQYDRLYARLCSAKKQRRKF